MDTEKPPTAPPLPEEIGIALPYQPPAIAPQPPVQETKEAESLTATPAEQAKSADCQPTAEATPEPKAEERPAQTRIYGRYEVDAEKFSTALWAIPRAPSPTYTPHPKPGHTHVIIDIHPTQAMQIALDSQRRLPPVYPVKVSLYKRAKKKLRERRCFIISAGLIFLGVMTFVCFIIAMLWLNRPGPKNKIAYDLYDKEWWTIW